MRNGKIYKLQKKKSEQPEKRINIKNIEKTWSVRAEGKNRSLLVHYCGYNLCSRAVGAFEVKKLGGDNSNYFETVTPNKYVYNVLKTVWIQRMLCIYWYWKILIWFSKAF